MYRITCQNSRTISMLLPLRKFLHPAKLLKLEIKHQSFMIENNHKCVLNIPIIVKLLMHLILLTTIDGKSKI